MFTFIILSLIVTVNSQLPCSDAELTCPYGDTYYLPMCRIPWFGCYPCDRTMVRKEEEWKCKLPDRCSNGNKKTEFFKRANDGCSGPEWVIDTFVPDEALPACDMHDLCYATGQPQEKCDDDFLDNLVALHIGSVTASGMSIAVSNADNSGSVKWGLEQCVAGSFIALWEGNDATQDDVCRLSILDHLQSIDFQNDNNFGCENDEARSLALYQVKKDTVIELFDSPSASREDDFFTIRVLQDITATVIGSFERDINTPNIEAIYNRNNGLDGKVSHIKIWPAGLYDPFKNANVVLYEGNDGTQNIVCTLPLTRDDLIVNFKNDDFGCDNDETRSLKILTAKKGTAIHLYDDPDGEWDDDVFVIEVLKDILKPIIVNSYERSINTEFIKGTYYEDNGLDGKVSRIRIDVPQ